MATGKTHSRFVEISVGGTAVQCGISSISNVGLTTEQVDVTTLCNEIMENIKGQKDLNIALTGPFSNAANGMHTVVQPLADNNTLTTVNIDIGIGAAPVAGDPRFEMTNVLLFDYLANPATGSAVQSSAGIRGGEGVTAQWTTI